VSAEETLFHVIYQSLMERAAQAMSKESKQ